MNYVNFTDTGLQMMHEAVHKAISADAAAMKAGNPLPCETSATQDWRDHANGLEDEMARRNVPFIPVRFLDRWPTGPELKQLRADLGEAVGKRLSMADMAKVVGLAPANGADTWRKWEDGAGPSGPVAVLLSLLRFASTRYGIPSHLFYAAEDGRSPVPTLRMMMLVEICHRLEIDIPPPMPGFANRY